MPLVIALAFVVFLVACGANVPDSNRAKADTPPDPYTVNAYYKVSIVPWVDPETGCKYLITYVPGNSNAGTRMILRMNRFGNPACPGVKESIQQDH